MASTTAEEDLRAQLEAGEEEAFTEVVGGQTFTIKKLGALGPGIHDRMNNWKLKGEEHRSPKVTAEAGRKPDPPTVLLQPAPKAALTAGDAPITKAGNASAETEDRQLCQ